MLDSQVIGSIDREEYEAKAPCPWLSIKNIINDTDYSLLLNTYPDISLFDRHHAMPRSHDQRPHDRYYLALEDSIYAQGDKDLGCIPVSQLEKPWQEFVNMLQTNRAYIEFCEELMASTSMIVRFAWHMTGRGCDVSPHLDDPLKLGSHLFYFNDPRTWKEEWGGNTLFLEGNRTGRMNPEIHEFEKINSALSTGNCSTVFRNTPSAWHSVGKIDCPEGYYRRIFTVIFQNKEIMSRRNSIKSQIKKLFRVS